MMNNLTASLQTRWASPRYPRIVAAKARSFQLNGSGSGTRFKCVDGAMTSQLR